MNTPRPIGCPGQRIYACRLQTQLDMARSGRAGALHTVLSPAKRCPMIGVSEQQSLCRHWRSDFSTARKSIDQGSAEPHQICRDGGPN